MNNRIITAGAIVSALAFSGAAGAADMPLKAPPPVAVVAAYSWTGCYFGGHIGALWVDKDWYGITGGIETPYGSHRASNWLAGGQVGCNYQVDRLVFGIQGDYAWTDAKGQNLNLAVPTLTDYSNVRNLGSVTGRIGYAWDRLLGYVKGGYAWERDRYSISGTVPAIIGAAVIPGGPRSYSASETRGGWTVGIGGEYAFNTNWTVFGEYDYYNFGNRTNRFTDDFGLLPPVDVNIRERKSVVKIGVNYKFGGAAVVAAAPVISK